MPFVFFSSFIDFLRTIQTVESDKLPEKYNNGDSTVLDASQNVLIKLEKYSHVFVDNKIQAIQTMFLKQCGFLTLS